MLDVHQETVDYIRGWAVVLIDRLSRSSQPVGQTPQLENDVLPVIHWHESVVTDARVQHILKPGHLQVNQQRDGRVHGPLGR